MTDAPTIPLPLSHTLIREPLAIDYGPAIEAELAALTALIAGNPALSEWFLPRWLALKLIEEEAGIAEEITALPGGQEVLAVAQQGCKRLRMKLGDDLDVIIADRRYAFASAVADEAIRRRDEADEASPTITDIIDSIVTHRWLGLPIFLLVMYLMFNMVINVATPYTDWVDSIITGPFVRWVAALLAALNAPNWLGSLALDGVIAGVGGVVVFVPSLLVLYFFITILEDSGYMARAAFITDRLMKAFGLHGKSFVPLILGFGCSVPAIYATRTLRNRRDRLLTSLMVPMMSCSARLPIYVVFTMALFSHHAGTVIWGLYAFGTIVAAVIGILFSRTLFREVKESAFVLELPPYRMPLFKNLWRYSWRRVGGFLRQAGTIIFTMSIAIWLLLNLPWGVENREESLYGRLSRTIAPVLAPAGFGNWEAAGSLITGFAAKEAIVATMAQIYIGAEGDDEAIETTVAFTDDMRDIGMGFLTATVETGKALVEALTPGVMVFPDAGEDENPVGDTALSQALREHFSALSALSFLAFVLLYVPCVATLGALKSEFGWKWVLFSAVYQTGLAWVVATIIYQGGRLLGFA